MTIVLWLLLVQGVIGAFDTLWFHEYRARLVAVPSARRELWIHGARSMIYGVLFGTLPWVAWRGALAWALAALIAAEIALTIADFIVEDRARAPLGGVFAGERATHTVMAIIYGAMLAHLVPVMFRWWLVPTAFAPAGPYLPQWAGWAFIAMAAGVVASGARDLYAAAGLRHGGWPYAR